MANAALEELHPLSGAGLEIRNLEGDTRRPIPVWRRKGTSRSGGQKHRYITFFWASIKEEQASDYIDRLRQSSRLDLFISGMKILSCETIQSHLELIQAAP